MLKPFYDYGNQNLYDYSRALSSNFQQGYRSSYSIPDFRQLYLTELLGLLIGLGILELHHLTYPRLLTEIGRLLFFTYPSLKEFQVGFLTLSLYFSVINGFEWFLIGSLFNSSLLLQVFLRALLLVLLFSYCILLIFLMILNETKCLHCYYLLCEKSYNCVLNLNLT